MTQSEAMQLLKSKRNVILTGAAGTGKSYLTRKFIQETNRRVGVVAPTGLAAINISGMTIHRYFGLNIADSYSDMDIYGFIGKSKVERRINSIDTLIIDEISMVSDQMFSAIERLLRFGKERKNKQLGLVPFGGVQIIVCGDFFQLPPVRKEGQNPKADFCFKSDVWEQADFAVAYLTEPKRQKGEEEFLSVLNAIRESNFTQKHVDIFKSRIGEPKEGVTCLMSKKDAVLELNHRKLSELSGIRTFQASFEGEEYHQEVIKKNSLAPEILKLAVGALVMFVKNDPGGQYVNGTQGKVTSLDRGYPIVRTFDGEEIMASPVDFTLEENKRVVARMTQIPLTLAWGITIHKSQGMTIPRLHVDVSEVFESGQGYVAFSRAVSLEHLTIAGLNAKSFEVHPAAVEFDKKLRDKSDKEPIPAEETEIEPADYYDVPLGDEDEIFGRF